MVRLFGCLVDWAAPISVPPAIESRFSAGPFRHRWAVRSDTHRYLAQSGVEDTTNVLLSAGVAVVADARLDDRQILIAALGDSVGPDATDPELLLAAYRRWGRGMLDHLDGEYAFVIVDPVERTLFAARDVMGLRPLMYALVGSRLALGSSIRTVTALSPDAGRALNRELLLDLMRPLPTWHPWTDQTALRDLKRLPPGSALVMDRSGLRLWVHSALRPDAGGCRSDDDFVDRFRDLFCRALLERSRLSRQPAVMVSGGVDSSAIACQLALSRRGRETPPLLYSWVFDKGHSADEREFIQSVGQQCAPSRHTLLNGDSCWGLDSDFPAEGLGEPDAWWCPRLVERVCVRAASDGADVVFLGLGADEVVQAVGYEFPQMFGELPLRHAFSEWPYFRRSRSALRLMLESAARGVLDRYRTAQNHDRRPPREVQGFAARRVWQNATGGKGLASASRLNGVEQAIGVACSLPFLDRRLVSHLLATPAQMRVRMGRTKYILREATRGIIPEAVRLRTVTTNFDDMMSRGLAEDATRIATILGVGRLVAHGILTSEEHVALLARVDDLPRQPAIGRASLLRAIHVEMWLQRWQHMRGSVA